MISRYFDLESVLQIELSGYTVKDLQEFSGQIMKTLNSIPFQDWPSKRMLGEFLLHKLLTLRRLERVIDEIKRSPENSSMRDFDFLIFLLVWHSKKRPPQVFPE